MKSPSRLRWLWVLLVVTPLVYACDQLTGVNPCNKLCDDSAQCGDGYQCLAGRCGGDKCGTTLSDAGFQGSSSGGGSGSSSVSSSSRSSSSGGSSGTLSSRASSGPLDAGVDAGPVDAGPTGCRVNGVPVQEGTTCGVNRFCNATGTCILGCLVSGSVHPVGADPTNACRRCAPTLNSMDWTNNPDGTLCTGTGGNPCTAFRCSTGACQEQPKCQGTTPLCTDDAGTCACNTSPTDTCAAGLNDHVCRAGGTCGCNVNEDCAGAHVCGPSHVCEPCSTTQHCGIACGACRSLPTTVGEGSYYTCNGNSLPTANACVLMACGATAANCDGDDGNQCEADLTSNAAHCGTCGFACGSGTCTASQCTCTTTPQCPAGLTCQGTACECNMPSDCPADAGYQCSNHVCVR